MQPKLAVCAVVFFGVWPIFPCSLPHTESAKDRLYQILASRLSRDRAQGIDGGGQIDGDEIGQQPLPVGRKGRLGVWISRFLSGEQLFNKRILIVFAGAVMGVGLVFSASRGGLIAAAGSMLCMGLLFISRKDHRRKGAVILFLFLITAVYALNIGIEYTVSRFKSFDVSFEVTEGEILGIIGPNGAGKTTLFNLISGFLKPTSGEIKFKGQTINTMKPHEISQMKIGRTFQATTLFMKSTVLENTLAGYQMNYKVSGWKAFFHSPSALKEDKTARRSAMEILERMGIEHLKDDLAENLSHGHQRILGICIALATKPEILFLDEPANGMNPEETENMVYLTKKLRNDGINIVVIEHDMSVVLTISDAIIVLHQGELIARGSPEEIKANDKVQEAYLGGID